MREPVAKTDQQVSKECRWCRHFRNDAAYIEAAFAGLASLSSGHGSARADDGICLRHGRYLTARSSCTEFSPAAFCGAPA